MSTENVVVQVVRKVGNGLPSDYKGIDLFQAGVLDSLAVMQMISELDEAFDIDIDVDDVIAENFNSLDNITKMVQKYLEKR